MKKRIYVWHRWLGIICAIPMVMWSLSGIAHPFMSWRQPDIHTQFLPAERIDVSAISHELPDVLTRHDISAIAGVRLVHISGELCYQVRLPGETVRLYFRTGDGEVVSEGDSLYAVELARMFYGDPGVPVRSVRLEEGTRRISHFTHEYGFINKRLPVVRVNYDTHSADTYYIETSTGSLAAWFDEGSRMRGGIFTMLHKWHFLDGLGTAVRDIIMVLFCLGLAFVAGSGFWMFVRKK